MASRADSYALLRPPTNLSHQPNSSCSVALYKRLFGRSLMFRYLPFIFKSSMRSKRRSLLTITSAAISTSIPSGFPSSSAFERHWERRNGTSFDLCLLFAGVAPMLSAAATTAMYRFPRGRIGAGAVVTAGLTLCVSHGPQTAIEETSLTNHQDPPRAPILRKSCGAGSSPAGSEL